MERKFTGDPEMKWYESEFAGFIGVGVFMFLVIVGFALALRLAIH